MGRKSTVGKYIVFGNLECVGVCLCVCVGVDVCVRVCMCVCEQLLQ